MDEVCFACMSKVGLNPLLFHWCSPPQQETPCQIAKYTIELITRKYSVFILFLFFGECANYEEGFCEWSELFKEGLVFVSGNSVEFQVQSRVAHFHRVQVQQPAHNWRVWIVEV